MIKKKINIIVPGRFHAELLADFLCKNNFDVKIYSSTPRFYFSQELKDKVVYVPMFLQIMRKLTGRKLPSLLRHLEFLFFDWIISMLMRKPDIVYGFAGVSKFCGSKYKDSLFILDRACPHIDFQTELMLEESKKLGMTYKPDQLIKARMIEEYELADQIFIPSLYTKRSFQKYGNVHTKTYQTNLDGKVPYSKEISHHENFIIGYLGGDNLIRKGLYYLLKAFEDDSLSEVTLFLRASHSAIYQHEEMNNIVKRKENILFKKRYKDIEDFYKEIDVLCVPSIDEGWGMVVLEALANGVPVICTSSVGSSELIEDGKNGFVVEPANSELIKEKIKFLIENPSDLIKLKKNSFESYLNFINSDQSYNNRLRNSVLFN